MVYFLAPFYPYRGLLWLRHDADFRRTEMLGTTDVRAACASAAG
jgi:hypothetical protein